MKTAEQMHVKRTIAKLRAEQAPIIHLHSTDLLSLTADISVSGVRRSYHFLTAREIDTLNYLFRISALKALNYAKKHSESSTMVEA